MVCQTGGGEAAFPTNEMIKVELQFLIKEVQAKQQLPG
jgi:hypothetical protein